MRLINQNAGYKLAIILMLAALLVNARAVSAQESDEQQQQDEANDEVPFDQIVVVAHKTERSVRDIASNVTVMSRQDLSANLATSVADVFRYSPGIDYEASGSRFGTEGINIRGIGGNRVAILVDGVPLSDQFDVGSFSNATRDFVNAGLIERIEILHGPASALYGSSAIGGVVAIRTPDPADIAGRGQVGGDVLATWRGSDESSHVNGMFAFGDAEKGLLLGGSVRSGHELDSAAVSESLDLRDYERRSAIAKYVANDRFGQTWRIGLIHQASEVSSALQSMLGSGRYRSTTALLGDDEYTLDLLNFAYEFGSPEGWVDSGVIRAYYETAEIRQETLDERGNASSPVSIDRFFSFDQEIRGVELNLQKSLSSARLEHSLGFGVEYRQRETSEYRDGLSTSMVDGSTTNVLLGEVFPLRDFPLSTSTEWGAYIEDTVVVGDWSIIAALRADQYDLSPSNDPMYAEDYPFAEVVSLSESDLSPKLGLIYRLNDATELYVQLAHGFRAPPYEDANIGLEIPLFNYRAIPNPDLKSESSNGFDVGVRWQGAESSVRLSMFRTKYTDFIESKVRLGTDPDSGRTLFQSQNLSETVIEGIEAGGHLGFPGVLQSFRIDGSFYIARGENRDNGQPLNSVGPPQAVVGISWNGSTAERQLRLQSTFTGDWDERDETRGELFKPPGHAVFDLYYTQKIADRTRLRLGLLNVTDKVYWNWSDVGGLSPTDPAIPYLAQAGLSVSASVNYSW
jgi:hemoglobin/transferrin/lactoferrin receptor protein